MRTVDSHILPTSSIPRDLGSSEMEAIPTTVIDPVRLDAGVPAFELFDEVDLCASRGEARRLIRQGGAYVNDKRIQSFDSIVGHKELNEGEILLRAGKKRYHRIRLKNK